MSNRIAPRAAVKIRTKQFSTPTGACRVRAYGNGRQLTRPYDYALGADGTALAVAEELAGMPLRKVLTRRADGVISGHVLVAFDDEQAERAELACRARQAERRAELGRAVAAGRESRRSFGTA